jgi:hypothetical protein
MLIITDERIGIQGNNLLGLKSNQVNEKKMRKYSYIDGKKDQSMMNCTQIVRHI